MSKQVIRLFLMSAGVLLLATAMAKIISVKSSAKILDFPDPVFLIPYRWVLLGAGLVEVGVAVACLVGREIKLQGLLLAWLSSAFILYRLGLVLTGYHKMCPCLGTLTQALHVRQESAALAMNVILGWLLFGSCAVLFWLRKHPAEAAWKGERPNAPPGSAAETGS